MPIYLTGADVARTLRLTTGAVRLMARRGELRVAAKTLSGIKLFLRKDVDRVVAARAARRALLQSQ